MFTAEQATGWPGAPGAEVGGDLAHVVHSHAYNVAATKVFLDVDRLDGRNFLAGSAAQLACSELRGSDAGPRALEALFAARGLGRLDLSGVAAGGGEALLFNSHFALGWRARFGRAEAPICVVPAGVIAGGLEAVLGRPFAVEEVECAARSGIACRFRVRPVDEGMVPATQPERYGAPRSAPAPPPPSPLEEAVRRVLFDAPLHADSEGRIHGPGGLVTRLWPELYPRASYRFERAVPREMGAKFANLPALVLTEAAHVHGFHGLGGLMRSPEWTARIRPLLDSREAWLEAGIAVLNALGWGTWRVQSLSPGESVNIRVYDSHEALAYRDTHGPAGQPRCYLARGTAAALMNLLYVGDITGPEALTPSYYNELFRSPLSFRAVETRCRAMDAPFCELIANPLSPNLSARLKELLTE